MRFLRFGLAALILASTASGQIVISQVYGGGGGAGAVYANDYVELFNPTSSPVTLDNWTIQYNSATGTVSWSGKITLTGTIGANKYFLVQASSSSGSSGTPAPLPLPTPDFTSTAISLAAASGKVALSSSTATLVNTPGPPVVCPQARR